MSGGGGGDVAPSGTEGASGRGATSWTLAIIKPDAFGKGRTGEILAHLEGEGFGIVACRVVELSRPQARAFYSVHEERPFFPSLIAFMTSGPCLALALERDDAVRKLRAVIGATDPAEAEEGTIRALYAESMERNAIHASDSPENAGRELAFFFPGSDLI